MNARTTLVIAALTAPARAQDEETSGAPPRLGIYQATIADLREPAAVAFAADGKLLVVEAHADSVGVFDANGARLATFGRRGSGEGELLDPHGVAVADWSGEVFVADSGNHRVVVFGFDGSFRGSFGAYGTAAGELRDPRGIAVAKDVVAVADTGNDRIQLFALSGAPLAAVSDGLLHPSDVAFDATGQVHVTDTFDHRVATLGASLEPLRTFGDFGPHPGFFAAPQGLAYHAGELYVVDSDNHRVQVFDVDGKLQYEWGLHALLPREGEGHLHYPSDVAIARDGSLAAVAEPFEDRVQLFRRIRTGEAWPTNRTVDRTIAAHFGPTLDASGDLLAIAEPGAPAVLVYDIEHDVTPWEPINITRWNAWGRGFGQLLWPSDAALDFERRRLYVADAGNATLLQLAYAHDRASELGYDPFALKLVRSLDFAKLAARGAKLRPTALAVHPGGDVYVVDSVARAVAVFSDAFELRRELDLAARGCLRPIALAFAAGGESFYVLDELGARVHQLALDGRELAVFGAFGRGDGEFERAAGIAVASDGSVLVSDSALDRVQRFGADHAFASSFGASGLGAGQFHKPRGLAFDELGRWHVLDWGNHRLQTFAPTGEFIAAFGSRLFVQPARAKR
jgi:DNA-binding beta-propeller fold protein YncE